MRKGPSGVVVLDAADSLAHVRPASPERRAFLEVTFWMSESGIRAGLKSESRVAGEGNKAIAGMGKAPEAPEPHLY